MEIGIIGLPRSGKTSVFNVLTKSNTPVANYSDKPNVGVAKVPDQRLTTLAEMYKPRRVVQAEVNYSDFPPPPEGFGKSRGIDGKYLNALQAVDALLIVIRDFHNPSVGHVLETVDSVRDTTVILTEMVYSDLEILDRRLTRIDEGFKAAKSQEREDLTREQTMLCRVRERLNEGVGLRDQDLSSDEVRRITGFGCLSIKPLIVVFNIGEDQMPDSEVLEQKAASCLSGKHIRTVLICAELEMALAQMELKEEQEFRSYLDAGESGLSRMIRVSYDVVDQVSFFTVGEDEVRAWQISRGTIAQRAAGKIHSDLERGFIRAEVISYDNLIKCGGLGEAKKLGVLRQEGKNYPVEDGDIMHVLFNV